MTHTTTALLTAHAGPGSLRSSAPIGDGTLVVQLRNEYRGSTVRHHVILAFADGSGWMPLFSGSLKAAKAEFNACVVA